MGGRQARSTAYGPAPRSRRSPARAPRADGTWKCPRGCFNQVPNYRYICNATLCDWSGQEYATLFDAEAAAVLGGHSANEIQKFVAEAAGAGGGPLPPAAEAIFADAMFKEFLFTTKAKQEERNSETRVQVTVVKVRELDAVKESKALINSLRLYLAAATA